MYCQFQLITGETSATKYLRVMLPVSYGLMALLFVCVLRPQVHRFLSVVGVLLLLLIGSAAVIELANVKLFQTEGTISLDAAGVGLNDLFIPAAELRQVEVKFTFARGRGAGRNGTGSSGNRISIHSKTNVEVLMAAVLVEAGAQRVALAAVLKEWRRMGVKISADGIDLA